MLHLLELPSVAPYYALFLAIHIVLLLLGLTCRCPRLVSLLIFVSAMNLSNCAWIIGDGGDNLMHLMLVYLIFMDPSPVDTQSVAAIPEQCLQQRRLPYRSIAGRRRLSRCGTGEDRRRALAERDRALLHAQRRRLQPAGGAAAHRAVSGPLRRRDVHTLAYQVSFPWLIWDQRVRPFLMTFGTVLHLQIALVMGLFSFGLAVMASYPIFFADERSAAILRRCRPLWSLRAIRAARPAPA